MESYLWKLYKNKNTTEKFIHNMAQRMKKNVIKRPRKIERFKNPFEILARECTDNIWHNFPDF